MAAPVVVGLVLGTLACAGFAPPQGTPVADPRFPASQVFHPEGPPKGVVVLLHGSEGGQAPYSAYLAKRLADDGYVAAVFCWYDCGGTAPDVIQRVPLERTVAFVDWVRANDGSGLPLTLYGASRGAEHAVLLASLLKADDRLDAVAVHAPSDTVVASFDPATWNAITVDGGYDAAWTWEGEPLYGERSTPPFGTGPRIAIEDYPGPLWLSHGEDDPLWPAVRSRALAGSRTPEQPTELVVWPDMGHVPSPRQFEEVVGSLEAFLERVD